MDANRTIVENRQRMTKFKRKLVAPQKMPKKKKRNYNT